MNSNTTSFLIAFPMSEIVTWGEDEYDDDDFYPNKHLQMLANYLMVSFPICHLYKSYFNDSMKGDRSCHFFKSEEYGNKTLLILDLHIYDKTNQHDLVYLGVKFQEKYVERIRNCLSGFLADIDVNPVINPYEESDNIDFLEEIIEKYKI